MSSILSFYKHQVTSLIWPVCFTRQKFNIFWIVILCWIRRFKRGHLCSGKVWQNVCVWYWFIFLSYLSPYLKKKMWKVISKDVSTKYHVLKAECAQTKSGNGAIGYRRKLPSVEITLPRDRLLKYQVFKNRRNTSSVHGY